jgi:hypothetical protein
MVHSIFDVIGIQDSILEIVQNSSQPYIAKINQDNGHEQVFQIFLCLASFCVQEPPIPYVSKVKTMDKVDGPDADKSEWIKLEFFMDPDNSVSGSKYS